MDIPPRSKVRCPDLVGSPLRAIIVVPSSWYCPNFLSPPSGVFLSSPLRATLDVNLSGVLTIIPKWRGQSWHCSKAKDNKKVEIKWEGLVGLGVFVGSPLSLLHVIGFSNGLLTLPSWDLIHVFNDDLFLYKNIASSAQRRIKKLSEYLSPWGVSVIWWVYIGPLLDHCLDLEIRLPTLRRLLINL